MKKILNYLYEYKSLSREEAKNVLTDISNGTYNESEISSFITVFLMRTITIQELQGFRDSLLEMCLRTDLKDYSLTDIVGTGGDGKNTFNISTISSFIVAGSGIKVAKHGNYGSTSVSGSSDVMKEVGYTFKSDSGDLRRELDTANICFLHAPLFHPALKAVSTIRKNLGVRTLFNMLGPLVNPVHPEYMLIGVYNAEMARIYNYILQQEASAFTIIHSLDGYDEISLTGDTKVITRSGEKIKTAESLGKRFVFPEDLYGGSSVKDAAKLFMKILKGEGTWAHNAVVLANAAMAIHTTGVDDYENCYNIAVESLESGKAYDCLKKII